MVKHPGELTGRTIRAKYEVGGLLGRGGFADVYAARHLMIERDVAVKVLKPEWREDASLQRRLVAEARLCSLVRHPNIIEVLDFETTAGGEPCLIMERVRGRSLRAILRSNSPPISIGLQWVDSLLAALEAAHRQGVTHGDIKPSNILVPEHGAGIKLIDFGAAHGSGEGPVTKLCGTPEYMAPEMVHHGATAGSDIYAVGVVLYELLIGRVPFAGRTPRQVLEAQILAPLVVPDCVARRPLGSVLQRALAKSPRQRYASVTQLRSALRGVARHMPLSVSRLKGDVAFDRGGDTISVWSDLSGPTLACGTEPSPTCAHSPSGLARAMARAVEEERHDELSDLCVRRAEQYLDSGDRSRAIAALEEGLSILRHSAESAALSRKPAELLLRLRAQGGEASASERG